MSENFGRLQGKVAIVTGASREIGAEIAETLARAGAAVLVAHHAESELANTVVARITASGGKAEAYDADCSSVAANHQLVAHAVELWGRLDIFVANAGLTVARPFLETDETDWNTVCDLNLKGSYFGAQAAARRMIAQGAESSAAISSGGRIIFSASVTGVQSVANFSAYGVTKAGLIHMARVLGGELGRFGITVNALGIGATVNQRNLADDPAYEPHWARVIPTGRVGYPADVAAAVMFLVSGDAAMVNGHTLMLDGGWTTLSPMP